MTIEDDLTLAEQRQVVRQHLQAQRQHIAEKIDETQRKNNAYPRSYLMRFMMNRPDIAFKLITTFSTFFMGKRKK